MTQPVLWALGVTSIAALVGTSLAARFETVSRAPPEQAPAASGAERTSAQRGSASAYAPNTIVVRANGRGHYHTDVDVAGRSLTMLVDTGASLCAFSYEDAQRLGLRVYEQDFTRRVDTANGTVAVANVRIPVMRVGTISIRDVEAVVLPRGRLGTSLLGMSFLRRLADFKMSDGYLTLRG